MWPKNVITQIFQRPYIFISILEDPFPEEDFEATNAKINYAQLELSSREANNNQNTAITAITSGNQPEVDKEDYSKSEANKRPRDYALIDFDRDELILRQTIKDFKLRKKYQPQRLFLILRV